MSVTKGPTANASTTSAFGGVQEVDLILMADLVVDEVRWDIHTNAGNFDLKLDGAIVNSRTGVSGDNTDMLSGAGPVNWSRGLHTVSLTRTSGSAGWRFRAANSYVDDWYSIGYWKTAGGGEIPGFRLVATADADWVDDCVATTWLVSGTNRTGITYTVTLNQPIILRGVTGGQDTNGAMELLVDGVVRGNNSTTLGHQTATTEPGAGTSIYCNPNPTLSAGAHTFLIRRVDLASFQSTPHLGVASASSLGGYFSQGIWTEPGTNVTPAYRLHFTPLDSILPGSGTLVAFRR